VIEIIRKSADLNPALAAIDHVVNCYFRDRALPWPH
jgi:hypothetical protein